MEKIEVYHAGTDRIESPDCLRGRRNLDFGRGFYITDVYDQAYNLALSLKPNNQICILNQDMLESHLKFTDCQIISSDGLL